MKKRNSKILSLLLAVTTVVSMNFPAGAEEPAAAAEENKDDHSGSEESVNGSAAIGVYGNYLDNLEAGKMLSVDVAWTSMYFQYASTQQGTWNPENHTYENPKTNGEWLNSSASITITNHSNTAVTANLGFEKHANSVTGNLSESTLKLDTAEDTAVANAPKETVTFTIGGSINDGVTDLGTVSVSLDANEENAVSGLNLSGKAVSEWKELIQAYLAEIDPEKTGNVSLVTTLGVGTVTTEHGTALYEALDEYYDSSNGGEVALTITDATEIGASAFASKGYHYNAVNLPNVTKINEKAFGSCSKITSAYLPKCSYLGGYAFSYCGSLTEVILETTITYTNGYFFGDSPDGSYDNFWGNKTNTGNITITVSKDQDLYSMGSSIYATTIGEGGTFIGQTFKEVKRAN